DGEQGARAQRRGTHSEPDLHQGHLVRPPGRAAIAPRLGRAHVRAAVRGGAQARDTRPFLDEQARARAGRRPKDGPKGLTPRARQYAPVDATLAVRENLRLVGRLGQLPRKVIPPRADELLARFDLTNAADRPVKTYSGGMRRRLDVAASLMQRPPVLFLDEPTTGLDLQSRNALWATIRELVAQGTTVLLTTQYLEEADRLANRVEVGDVGRVIAEGTPA